MSLLWSSLSDNPSYSTNMSSLRDYKQGEPLRGAMFVDRISDEIQGEPLRGAMFVVRISDEIQGEPLRGVMFVVRISDETQGEPLRGAMFVINMSNRNSELQTLVILFQDKNQYLNDIIGQL